MKPDSITKQERSVNRRVGTFSVPTHASLSSDKISDDPEWQEITLGDLTKESAFGPRFSSDLYSENGNVGTIRTTDLNDEGIINYQTIPYANLCEDSFKNHYLNNGDLLITRSGTCGIPCIFQRQEKPIVAGAFLIRFILKDTVDPTYLHLLLKSSDSQAKIQKMASGGVQKNLTGTNLKKLKINLPPLHEQKKIARILSTWDKAIETVEKLIDNSKAQKKALMQQLLTGKWRLPGFDEKWKNVYLGEVAKINSGGTPKSSVTEYYGGDIPWVSIADMTNHGKYISSTKKSITTLGLKNSSAQLYPKNTVLYAMYASIGKCSISFVELCSSQAILGIQPNSRLYYQFLYYHLSLLKEKIKQQGQQGTQANLNAGMVKNFKLNLPSIEEQQKISALLTIADKEIEILQQKLDCLKQEKKALMQQLLTGKRRVKVDTDG